MDMNISNISNKKISHRALLAFASATALISSCTLASCHDANASKDSAESSLGEPRPDDALNKLMRSLADGDAPGFAALCVYPIQRPYPLKDIEDSLAMVDYFPVLVDDAFKDRMAKADVKDWENYGWRGWSIGDDNALWFDDGLWAFSYLSPAESGLQKILAREEIMTLAPEYREGWTPVAAMAQSDGGSIFRIDSKGDEYRLMKFDDPADVMRTPNLLLIGSLRTEGSADSRIFEFSEKGGVKAEYLPDAESDLFVYITGPRSTADSIPVRPAYWREIIR